MPKVGFKDLCPLWKAAEFDPEHLMGLYKRAGAKYFVSMGVHHDNFDLWNSRHTRWNAVKVGPHKDVVGLWRTAALKHGLKFGVSEHLWISYKWFAVSHGSDKTGPLAGVHYDGVNPAYADLYHDASVAKWADDTPVQFGWNDLGMSDAWRRHWFLRIQDLVEVAIEGGHLENRRTDNAETDIFGATCNYPKRLHVSPFAEKRATW
jgi:alpha-L-fucosidase